ncbi:unnamed protein product [Paramecium octaurelia]|uniref:Uncharacterized protein n=1 Tax=Paramecium octaurelia TaxID=43137 RepID=A0A8S1XZE9_PAROT|nr:unnamed protein product [Paramecium octaurelia]
MNQKDENSIDEIADQNDLVWLYNQALKPKKFDQILLKFTNIQIRFYPFNQEKELTEKQVSTTTIPSSTKNIKISMRIRRQQQQLIILKKKILDTFTQIFYLNVEIHSFVGSCLKIEIYEFEPYMDHFKERDKDAYQQVIENVLKNVQQKGKMNNNASQWVHILNYFRFSHQIEMKTSLKSFKENCMGLLLLNYPRRKPKKIYSYLCFIQRMKGEFFNQNQGAK